MSTKEMFYPAILHTRVTEEDKEFILERAKLAKMSPSQYLREQVIKTWREVIEAAE